MDFPETVVETPLGKLRVWTCDGVHISASTRDGGDESVRINGVDYHVRVDCRIDGDRYSDGRTAYVYMSRVNSYKVDDWTWPARKRVEALIPWLREWAIKHFDFVADGRRIAAKERLAAARAKLERAQAEVAEANAELSAAAAHYEMTHYGTKGE